MRREYFFLNMESHKERAVKRKSPGDNDDTSVLVEFNGFMVPRGCDFKSSSLYLARTNPFPQDKFVVFEDTEHKYYVCGSKRPSSTTGVVHEFVEEFDANSVAYQMVANSARWQNVHMEKEHYRKCNVDGDKEATVRNILNWWEENRNVAAAAGSYNHRQLELFFNGLEHDTTGRPYELSTKFRNEYLSKTTFVPFRTEMIVHSCDIETRTDPYLMCGSIDMLFLEKEGNSKRIVIFDWKFTIDLLEKHEEKMQSRFKKKCAPPFNNVWDTSLAPYIIQLNIYRWFLETFYDKDVVSMHLGVFHQNQDDYIVVDVPCLREVTASAMETRRQRIEASDDSIPYKVTPITTPNNDAIPTYTYLTRFARENRVVRISPASLCFSK